MKRKGLFHFKGVTQEMETKEERIKRKQMQFKKQYNAYVKRRRAAIKVAVNDEINEFVNRVSQ